MPKSSFVDFKAIKSVLTMERVLGHYDLISHFKRSGDSLSGPCPIHGGSNPTQFRVSVSKNIWNCFSECKHGGNVLDFIARMEKVSIHAAALKAIEWFDLDLGKSAAASCESDAETPTAKRYHTAGGAKPAPVKKDPAPEQVGPNKPLKFRLDKLDQKHPYLAERGLTEETIADFELGYCAKGVMADRIAIPIRNPDGEVVAYAGRFVGEPPEGTAKYKLPQGFRKSLELFNVERAFKETAEAPLVIVEGFFGCMWLHQHGCRKVVALMGNTLSQVQEDLIRQHTDRNTRAIVMLDEDEAGRLGRDDVALRLSKFLYVNVYSFREENAQPETLSADDVAAIAS